MLAACGGLGILVPHSPFLIPTLPPTTCRANSLEFAFKALKAEHLQKFHKLLFQSIGAYLTARAKDMPRALANISENLKSLTKQLALRRPSEAL